MKFEWTIEELGKSDANMDVVIEYEIDDTEALFCVGGRAAVVFSEVTVVSMNQVPGKSSGVTREQLGDWAPVADMIAAIACEARHDEIEELIFEQLAESSYSEADQRSAHDDEVFHAMREKTSRN